MTEEQLHRSVAQYLDTVLMPPAFWTTFPAGGGGKVRGAKLKAMGLKAGIADILIWWPDQERIGCCLAIELKASKGRLSAAQIEAGDRLAAAGVYVEICRSVDDVRDELKLYGVPTRDVRRQSAGRGGR